MFAKVINISCFGAIRPMKNHLIQAMAAIKFAEDHQLALNFHINNTRIEQRGDNVRKNLIALFDNQPQHNLIVHPWMSHKNLLSLITEEIDIGMQVSFTETFNIVSADHIHCGVPMVTSKEVTFVALPFRADPTDIKSIIRALKHAYWAEKWNLHNINKQLLEWSNYNATIQWGDELGLSLPSFGLPPEFFD